VAPETRDAKRKAGFAGKAAPSGASLVGAPCAPFEAGRFDGARGAPYELREADGEPEKKK